MSSRPAWTYAGGGQPPSDYRGPEVSNRPPSQGSGRQLDIASGVRTVIGGASGGRPPFGSDKEWSPPTGGPSSVPGVTMSAMPQFSGTYGSQRMGSSTDRFEAFPYGRVTISKEEAELMYDRLSPAYQDWLNQLAKTPGIGAPTSTGRAMWGRFVEQSVFLQEQGLFMSPQQMAQQIAMQRGIGMDLGDPASYGLTSGGSRGYGGGYGGGSSTQQTIDLTSPQQARGLLMQTIQGVLGRNPTDVEYDDFVKILNETQTANPQVVSAAGGTVTRSGGVDAGLVALDYAQSRDDYENRQVSGYYDMFMNALAGG